jgi:hypothetical protein
VNTSFLLGDVQCEQWNHESSHAKQQEDLHSNRLLLLYSEVSTPSLPKPANRHDPESF